MFTIHFGSFTQFYPGKIEKSMPQPVDFFTSCKTLFFSFKNVNVKIRVGNIVAVNKLTV